MSVRFTYRVNMPTIPKIQTAPLSIPDSRFPVLYALCPNVIRRRKGSDF